MKIEEYLPQGHPKMSYKGSFDDAYLIISDFLEEDKSPIYDINGGEFDYSFELDGDTYTLNYYVYNIEFEDTDEFEELKVELTGKLIEDTFVVDTILCNYF